MKPGKLQHMGEVCLESHWNYRKTSFSTKISRKQEIQPPFLFVIKLFINSYQKYVDFDASDYVYELSGLGAVYKAAPAEN